jgi:hypothetical protein
MQAYKRLEVEAAEKNQMLLARSNTISYARVIESQAGFSPSLSDSPVTSLHS